MAPLAACFFFFFTVFFFFLFFFFAEKTFADCLLVAPKDAMSRNFAEKNVRKYPQNLEIHENLLPLKVFLLYGILSLVSNQRNPIAVFLFFCYQEKMNWLKTQTQSTHLFTWLADWSSPKFPVNFCASQFVKVISQLSVLSYQEVYVWDHCYTWYTVIETKGFSCLLQRIQMYVYSKYNTPYPYCMKEVMTLFSKVITLVSCFEVRIWL